MMSFLIVFLGAGLGGAVRHAVNLGCLRVCGPDFPFGTLMINIAGSLAMGLVAGWFAYRSSGSSAAWRLFLTTGFLGGFTTFSAFSLEFALLWSRHAQVSAIGYAAASVVLAVLACFLGLAVARSFA